jgi:hypothetical protein
MSVPSLNRIIHGPLSRRESLLYRLPAVTMAAAGAVSLLGIGAKAGADHLTTDYGCATATVPEHGTTISTAVEAASKVAPLDNSLESAVTHAAQVVPGAGDVPAGQEVQACVTNNPVYGFGENGWMAHVQLVQQPATAGN